MINYDLIIFGGGTAGCAAAYTAGKLGFKTLLVEKKIHLGGSITSGLVVPAMKCGENQINTDFFEIFTEKMSEIGGQIEYQGNKGWYNPELAKIVLEKLMSEAHVDVVYNISTSNIEIKDKNIKSIKLLSPYNDTLYNCNKLLSEPIATRYVIDATGNCEIGKICGCNFLNKKDELQPVSLRFIMSNVDLNIFSEWLLEFDNDREVTSVEYINGQIHLSTACTWDKKWALTPLFDNAVKQGVLKDTDRNYFQIFTIAGMPDAVSFNCPRIVEQKDLSLAIKEAHQAIFRLSDFCKKYLPGFENAYISNIADELGIRVSARIKGKYVYTQDDILSGKHFKNPVVRSNYPIDVHSTDKGKSTLMSNGEYELPVEALMSADIENLFVAGRCLSADFMAQGALRVQPSCFSMGEGLVKYISNHQS